MELLESRRLLAAAALPVLIGGDGELTFTNYIPPQRNLWESGGYLTSPSGAAPLDIALTYLKQHAAELGVSAADVQSLAVTDQYSDTVSGLTHIYLQQQLNGLPIVNADVNVNVTRDGRILSINGGLVNGVDKVGKIPAITKLAPTQALSIAAGQLGLSVAAQAQTLSRAQGTARQTQLAAPLLSLDPIPLQLQYIPTADGQLDLAWSAVLRTPDGEHWYDVAVSDAGGRVAFANDWVDHASYNVLPLPVESPQDGPSSPNRSILTDPWNLTASPFGWQDTNGVAGAEFTDTRGNNVSAQEDVDHNNLNGFRPDGGASLNFDFPLNLSLAPSGYQSAAIANLFYWNNLLHDVHYAYGFTEAAGNFQVNNYGRGGSGNDAVQADAQDGSGVNNANFATPPDGSAGRMQMYIFNYTSPNRDGDLDSGIVVHEYGHGVTNRLTGGPANANALTATQSGGMGEGWSDFYALMFLQRPTDTQAGAYPMGTYVLGQSPTGGGIRRKPYSFNMSIDPLTVDAYGTSGSGGGVTRSTEVHDTGEIWATTLWDMNWLLINKYGFEPTIANGYNPASPKGNTLALQLVMDALKIQPSNPSFKNARDAILQADVNLTGGANQGLIWQAFARRGMGLSFVDSSSSATSVTPAYDVPIADPIILDATPFGGSLTPVSSATFHFNKEMDQGSFDPSVDVVSFIGPGNSDLRSTISGYQWLSSTQLRINFATVAQGSYTMKIGPNILALDDGHAMDQDGNGTPGEAGDAYTLNFSFGSTLGPDGFGYKAKPFSFEDIDYHIGDPGVGTLINGVDDGPSTIFIGGNTFNFYGTTYSQSDITVTDNGLITFGGSNTSPTNTDLSTSPTQPSIAVLWDDWRTNRTASGATDSVVLYKTDDLNDDMHLDRLVIEWSDVPHYIASATSSGAVTFQAILELNTGSRPGRIILNYRDLNASSSTYDNGASATIAIKADGTQGANRLLISQNSLHPWVQSNSAILISPDVDPPTVVSEGFVNLTAPKYVVTFSESIVPPTVSAALLLTDTTTSLVTDPAEISSSYDDLTRTLTFTLPTALANGNYTATLFSAGIVDLFGNALDGDGDSAWGGNHTFNFFDLAGDANHDRVVNIYDLVILATNWYGTGKTFAEGDFNYDSVVNSADLGILAMNWQQTLAPPAQSLTATPTAARPAARTPTRTPTRVADLVL